MVDVHEGKYKAHCAKNISCEYVIPKSKTGFSTKAVEEHRKKHLCDPEGIWKLNLY